METPLVFSLNILLRDSSFIKCLAIYISLHFRIGIVRFLMISSTMFMLGYSEAHTDQEGATVNK